ncbi:MAG: bifunctional homocysteine S-methyltransferase/methylenetetrahydrofolate reductase [Chloroflexota bacterium]
MEHAFQRRLNEKRTLLADGALGTELYSRGVAPDQCFDAQNLGHPTLIEHVHRDYIHAGAELIETNTFGSNRIKLEKFGFEDRVREINMAGARIARGAREVCGQPCFVGGSVGPTGQSMEPYGYATRADVRAVFREQMGALVEGGVDLLVLETFQDLREILEAIRAAREVTELPIIAQMTFSEDLVTPIGNTPEQVVEALAQEGVDVIGANCSVGSSVLLEVVQRLIRAGAPTVSAMPNAGWPTRVANRVLYQSSPDYMAEYGQRMAAEGVAIVGGCCGTTPAHIKALKRSLQSRGSGPASVDVLPRDDDRDVTDGGMSQSSELSEKLGRTRVISVEVRPPRGANPAKALEGAELLKQSGADSINVLDSAMARVRMSAVATAVLIKKQTGIETIVHFTTRDRNLMAIQSDLIGAHAMGIRNVLALTGDPPSLGDYATSKAVYDVDAIGLIRIMKQLNQGVDIGGNSIGTPTRFLVGAALNPTADDLDWQLDRFAQKVEAGADFVMTQPVYDAELFRSVLDRVGPIRLPILMGILPLQSYRHALFLHNELPGVQLTDDVLRRMELAGTQGIAEGLKISHEIIDACAHLTAGLYIMPSFGRYEVAAQLVASLHQAV